jgi:ComF family protein
MAYLRYAREFARSFAHSFNHSFAHSFGTATVTALRGGCRAAMARLPVDCLLCGQRTRADGLCPPCLAELVGSMRGAAPRCPVCALALNGLGRCPDCAMQRPAFDRVVAAFDYAHPGDLLVRRLKAGRRFDCAPMLAAVLARQIQYRRAPAECAGPGLARRTIVAPVPSGKASVRRRGFNPAAEVARCLARQLHLAYNPALVQRVRQGGSQKYLSHSARLRNTRNMYRCGGNVARAHVAVVDDVLTTGGTAHSIALQLKAAGAASVSVWVLARTPYHCAADSGLDAASRG